MARCFYCCHCGRCGPGSDGGGKLNPPGYCPFCQTRNPGDATVCTTCGKTLPKPAGVQGRGSAGQGDGKL